jgi:hypothetical protein
MSINNTPNLGEYTELTPFRYWCQKVLPLVYDDSLSYYELLCKVVDYLNKTMHDVETLHGDVVSLHTAYVELQSYVNDYFDNLDVQKEINNKLDKMASDGSLSTIIAPYVQVAPVFVDSVSDMTDTKKIYVLKSDGHLYYYDASWKDSGIAYGINGLYPINVDYASWVDTINAKQPFGRRYSQFVNNAYNEVITNGSFDGKPKFVESNSSLKDATSGVIGYELTTHITDISNFTTEYRALVYTPVPVNLTVYAMDSGEVFSNSFTSDMNVLTPGVNTINFVRKKGSPSAVTIIAMEIPYSESLTPSVIDKISIALVKGTTASRKLTVFSKNIDYSGIIDTINAKQPFGRRYSQFVNNAYNEVITNGSFDGKPKFVESNSSLKDATSGVIGYELTTHITDISNFTTEYRALVYTPVPVNLTVYAMDSGEVFSNSFTSDMNVLTPGVNTINFVRKKGSPSAVTIIAMEIPYSESLTPSVIDKISIALVKGTTASPKIYVNCAFIGDSLTAQNYMQFFSGNNFKTYTYAVGGDGISKIFARTNIDTLYANNTGTISNGTVLELSQSGMFLQDYGNTNPVSVNNHTFDIKRTKNTYTVDNLSEPFNYFGEPFICNIANTDFSFYVIWCGTNNLDGNTDDIFNGWKKAKKVYPNCILIGLTWDSFDGALDKIHTLDTLALKEFGSRYISLHDSIVKYGLSYNSITPTSNDTANINAGKIPPSLLSDSVHFNEKGQKYVAHLVQERLKMFGID